ncbi:hypothetical protein WL76_03215 [Burkholderia ubonensis]|uniref:glycosyltransferase family 4 protein n=1 Tax=Burkholderia ubonensis TaxID=101571 RepID=UPI00075D9485|nr:glycosyltransferase [Burkholderia ubonensis]KWE61110.1 hypothetical protein WL76_03215 [Burkholderia ubonensis]
MRLFISAPDIFPGDAVGNHCFSVARAARRLGMEVRTFARAFDGDVEPIEAMFGEIRDDDILFVSYSIFDPMLERLLLLPGHKIGYFHGVTTPELLREFEPVTADLCARSVEQFPLLSHFDVLLANSRWTAQSLAPYLDVDRVQIVPPVSADMPIFHRKQALHASHAQLNLMTVGRVVPHKRIEDAIDVLARVRRFGCDARLTVVGSAPNRAYSTYLTEHARELGMDSNVDFTGMVDEQHLFAHFDAADVMLSVSLHEGFCVPVLEAMSLGLPAIVRAGTAASEVGGGAAVVFEDLAEASDAICRIHGDPRARAGLIEAGKRRATDVLAMAGDAVFQNIFLTLRASARSIRP